MKSSVNCINLIKEFESLHDGDLSVIGLQPKMCPSGIWTEGYGRAMRNKNGVFLKGTKDKKEAYANITIDNKQEAEKALVEDLGAFERIVSSKVRIPLNQNQFDALVSYTYNTGGSDTLFKLINQKAPEAQIKKWFETKYITGGGRTLPGLIRRRKAESTLYFK
jgi:lysozyme